VSLVSRAAAAAAAGGRFRCSVSRQQAVTTWGQGGGCV